jgi:hypothetical protein
MSGLEWTTPRIEEVPMDGRYCALYRQALEEEPLAPWEKDAFCNSVAETCGGRRIQSALLLHVASSLCPTPLADSVGEG